MDKPYVYGDNMSVCVDSLRTMYYKTLVTNESKPELMLRKKSNLICYHAVYKAIVMSEALVAHIPTTQNLADLFMKVLYGQNQRFLVDRMLWDVYPST